MNNKGFRNIVLFGIGALLAGSVVAALLFGWGAFILFFLCGSVILGIFLHYTHQRYKDLERVNDYFSKILAGEYELSIGNNEEGEISILQNNIYKATVQLREKNDLLEKEKTYLVDMLANISHQLKTPLTSMMMMNELLAKEESEEKRQEFIDIEEKQLEKMNWLIQNLLKLSKLDAGTIQLKKEKVSITKLIEESVSSFLIQMDIEGISLEKHLKETTLEVDFNWTVEAIRNIVKNCIEHMGDDGRFSIENAETNLYHVITIRDNGCGISKEDLPHIFERFFKGKKSDKESVGIGLALSNTIIKKEHGEILVSSEINKGTVFEIKFYKSII